LVLVRPCKTTAAYEALPEQELRLDLEQVRHRLTATGWIPVADAGVLLVMRKDVDATVFRSGKLLIKTLDQALAQRVWDEVSRAYDGGASDGR